MYILKNSLISIARNKGRNILIGIIILVIACASTVTLAIRNTANNLVKDYEESHDITGTISFDRGQLSNNFKGGEDAQKSNIEAFNNIESITLDDVKNYGDSEYLKGYYYLYATSLNSDTLTKATDSFEYEVEDRETTTISTSTTTGGNGNGIGRGPGGGEDRHTITNNNTTTIITKSKEKFESSKNLTGDFELDGYSSYDAMTEFVNGTYQITDGEIISDFESQECVISSELATLNEITVGQTITLKNPNTEATYEFVVKGIYKDNSDSNDSSSMYSKSANKIITGSKVIENLVVDDSTLVTTITPTFILKDKDSVEKFTTEIKEKGLSEYYTLNTNVEELESATKSIENVKTFATTFLLIMLAISAVVLFVINMINIRERKYEIGVFRTIGVSKFKLTLQFALEILIVSVVMLGIGAVCGSFLAKPVGNMLLENEIQSVQEETEQISNNFGKGGPMDMNFGGTVNVQTIDTINAVVDITVVAQLLGIGLALMLVSSLASMISIQRFSPLTILNYEFEQGKMYAIKGKSGSGKTTLLSLITGLEKCTDGKVLYDGKDLKKMNLDTYRNTDIGIVFQSYNLLPSLTAIENIILSMDISKVKVNNKKEKALSLMKSVGLSENQAKRKILKLSGGEQQRIAIARSLSYNPKIIIADEPTGNLDKDTENDILNIFEHLAKDENKCIIIVTHSQNVCDRADIVYELKK